MSVNLPTGQWELISPKLAAEYLKKSTGNRNLNARDVAKYSEDMREGRWQPNPDPIIISEEDSLDNGHHRLTAVSDSGTSQPFFVVRGTKRDLRLVLDGGRPRSDADALKIAGTLEATANRIGVLKRTLTGLRVTKDKKMSRAVLLHKWQLYKDSIMWAEEGMPRKYRSVALLAALTRAHLAGADFQRLTEFRQVFITDSDVCVEETLQPAYKLKSLIDSRKVHSDTSTAQLEMYSVCLRAIHAFMQGEILGKKALAQKEYYPLPTEPTKAENLAERLRYSPEALAAM